MFFLGLQQGFVKALTFIHIFFCDFLDFRVSCGTVGDHYDVERVTTVDFILLFN